MKKQLALVFVFVLAALVGGCARALPPIQTESSDYSAPRCESKETEKERGDCYRERSKLAEQLLEAGAKSESHHDAASVSPPGAPQPSFIPNAAPAAAVVGVRYVVRRDPIGGNSENGCGGPMDLTLRNGVDALVEVTDGGESLQRCGNGASLFPIIAEMKNGGVRIALVTPQGRESTFYHTLTGKRTVMANAFAATPNAGAAIPADVLDFAMTHGGSLPPGTTASQPGFVQLPNGIVLPTVPQMGRSYVSSGVFPVPGGLTLDVRKSHFGF